jgi:hypothetical protein
MRCLPHTWVQPLSNNEDLDERLVNDEQKKERRKNRKEQNDGYQWSVFCQKCYNEGHLTKECKLLHTICNIYKKQGHETNDCPLKEFGGQYVKKDISVNVIQLEAPNKQVK